MRVAWGGDLWENHPKCCNHFQPVFNYKYGHVFKSSTLTQEFFQIYYKFLKKQKKSGSTMPCEDAQMTHK